MNVSDGFPKHDLICIIDQEFFWFDVHGERCSLDCLMQCANSFFAHSRLHSKRRKDP